ncbi:MAG: NAD(+)/NADH kinase [Ktedonobacteraceae bacterium]|nr:NAD(+)/NADH kinase [Ktedonobacteraceae bacterium]
MARTYNRAIIIHSPYARRADRFRDALSYLRLRQIEPVEMISIADLDGQPPQGRVWKARGVDLVIAAGGDGTIGGVVTHIAEYGLPLAILPLGTANDIARSLGIPQDLQQAAEVVATGQERVIDIGVAQPAEQAPHPANIHPGIPGSRHVTAENYSFFAHALTVGVNVEFARKATDPAVRERYGSLTYPFTALEVLRNHTVLHAELQFAGVSSPSPVTSTDPTIGNDQLTLKYRILLVAVVNTPVFGGTFNFTLPGVRLTDRLLDVIIVEDVDLESLSERLANFMQSQKPAAPISPGSQGPAPLAGRADLSVIPGIHHLRARGVVIATEADPQDVTVDGEIRGQTPIRVRTADEQLRVIVPTAPISSW